MLNENHAFILDFPDLKLDIVQLNHDDEKIQSRHAEIPPTRLRHPSARNLWQPYR